VDNIKMDLGEIGWCDIDWIDLAQNLDQWTDPMNTVKKLLVPKNSGKLLSSCTTGGLWRRAQLHGVSYVICALHVLI
jgi:hypothetical protein